MADADTPIRSALAAENFPQAIDLARQAIAAGNASPLALNLRAFWFEGQGRVADALADLQQAHALAPEDVPVLNALGLIQGRMGLTREANESFRRVVAIAPDFGPGHFNAGWTSEDLGDLQGARMAFTRAATLDPSAALPAGRLAAIAVRLGQWDEARSQAERALALDPRLPIAATALAAADMAAREFDAAERRLQELITRTDMPDDDLASALGQMGDVLDAGDRPAEAFAAYSARNAIIRRVNSNQFSGADIETMPQYMNWLIAMFEAASANTWAMRNTGHDATPAAGHAFLVGFPRSGTTLLEEILASHQRVVSTQERDTLHDGVRAFLTEPAGLERLAAISQGDRDRYRATYWDRVRECGVEPARHMVLDKLPLNAIKLPLISQLFPQARILFAIRDPRDVVLSCYRRRFRLNPSMYEFLDLEGAARFYDRVMRLMDLYRAKLPLNLHVVRHESLVVGFESQSRAVCAFLGLEWDAKMEKFAENAQRRMIATPSAVQVARGLNRDGIGQWRRYRKQLAPILPILEPWVRAFGYESD